MAPYADTNDLIDRYDERTIGDLLSDDGAPVTDITGNSKLAALLASASGRLEAAALRGGVYTTDQLDALTDNSLALLKEIVCDLAMLRLIVRRPEKFADEQRKAIKQESEDYLTQLMKGERLFNIAEQIDAGLPTIDGPSAVDYETLNLIPDRVKNYYPARVRRLPLGRG